MMFRQAISRAVRGSASTGGDPGRQSLPKRSRLLAWLCVLASTALAGAALVVFETSVWRALLVAILLACPVAVIVAYVTGMRPPPFPIGDVPVTRGHALNWIAPYYDAVCRLVGLGTTFRRHVVAIVAIRPGDTVLDVGCGTGVLTRLAADAAGGSGAVWGIDPAPDMVRVAMIKAAEIGNAARFKPGAIENLEFGAGSFDVVLISLVLHHLPADVRAVGLREVRRVLKPRGRLAIVEFDHSASALARYLLLPLRASDRIAELLHGDMAELLRAAGFEGVTPAGRWGVGVTLWTARRPAEGADE